MMTMFTPQHITYYVPVGNVVTRIRRAVFDIIPRVELERGEGTSTNYDDKTLRWEKLMRAVNKPIKHSMKGRIAFKTEANIGEDIQRKKLYKLDGISLINDYIHIFVYL